MSHERHPLQSVAVGWPDGVPVTPENHRAIFERFESRACKNPEAHRCFNWLWKAIFR